MRLCLFFLLTEQLGLDSGYLLLVDPADESVLLRPELHVELLLEAEASDDSSQIILQRPLPVSGHQEVPVEQRCSHEGNESATASSKGRSMVCFNDNVYFYSIK